MSRGPQRTAVALITASLLAAVVVAQGNQGVIFSEIAHGPSLPPVTGVPMPSYIELVNVEIANPVIPPPVPIGNAANPATIVVTAANSPPVVFSIPPGFLLGGNVQPPPATQPPAMPVNPPVLVIASGPFPAGVLPTGVVPIIAPSLFSGALAVLGAPGIPFELCFNNPATLRADRVKLGPPTPNGCAAALFNNTLTVQPTTGKAIRWCYVDSNTDLDFDPALAISPGAVNPEMTHVNGFFFGTPTSATLSGTPLVVTGSPTGGTLAFPATARVKSVHFMNSFLDRTITNPAFDPIINSNVTMTAGFTAQNPAISQPGFLPGLQIMNETMTITATHTTGTGLLGMPMNLSTQVGSNIGPSAAASTDVRPERIFSDLVTDAAAFTLGASTGVMVDVIPPSTGGGNTWCEIIVYDYQGNQYRAKVKNWPPGGACTGPLLGLGTDGFGSFTLIDLCFTPGSMIANLFSATPSATCPGPLLPPGGICPDGITVWILTPPQLGAPPFFVTADAAGMYLFQMPSGSLPAGLSIEGIGLEWTLAPAIVAQSAVNSVTF